MATYIWDQIEKCNNRISRCLSSRELAAATYCTPRHQSVSTVREGKGRRRASRRGGTLPEPRKPVMTVAGTRVSSACASKAASERFRENRASGRRSGGSSVRKRLEKESRGPRNRAVAVVLATLGSSSRAAAAVMWTGLCSEFGGGRGVLRFFFSFWGVRGV